VGSGGAPVAVVVVAAVQVVLAGVPVVLAEVQVAQVVLAE